MTNLELHEISNEIKDIEKEFSILDDSNPIESRRIEALNNRLDQLESNLTVALAARKRKRLKLVEKFDVAVSD